MAGLFASTVGFVRSSQLRLSDLSEMIDATSHFVHADSAHRSREPVEEFDLLQLAILVTVESAEEASCSLEVTIGRAARRSHLGLELQNAALTRVSAVLHVCGGSACVFNIRLCALSKMGV